MGRGRSRVTCGEPDAGLYFRTLGSRLEPKADAQPLSHPGVPRAITLKKQTFGTLIWQEIDRLMEWSRTLLIIKWNWILKLRLHIFVFDSVQLFSYYHNSVGRKKSPLQYTSQVLLRIINFGTTGQQKVTAESWHFLWCCS